MIVVTPKHPAVKYGPFGRRGEDDQCWKLTEKLHVIWEDFDFNVPKGFLCDMGSVPRIFWPLVSPTGPGNIAFLAHDFVYAESRKTPKDKNGVEMSREQADDMMKALLVYGGMSKWRAFIAWRGVRRGGWLSWKKKAPEYFAGSKKRRKTDG